MSGASNDLIDIDGITSSRRSTLKEPAIKARFEPLGVTVAGSREKLAVKVKTDAELWGPLQQSAQHPGRVKSQTSNARLLRVIFDRSIRFCLPVHVCFAPKTDLRPDRIEIGYSPVIQASKLGALNHAL